MPEINLEQVWLELSELFLDTELSDGMLRGIARELAATNYSTDSIYQILLNDVLPVCGKNLSVFGGAWSGFDRESLLSELRNFEKASNLKKTVLRKLSKRRLKLIQNDWIRVKKYIDLSRSGGDISYKYS